MERICVFCGSSPGAAAVYRDAAGELAAEIVSRKLELVYGGGSVGLMGNVAAAVLEAGGRVTGVIPEVMLDYQVYGHPLSDLRVVSSMHERKALMAELADGFIALPGGFGTFEEFLEAVTWAQLGLHQKPCGLLNAGGFYRPLLDFLEQACLAQFIAREHFDIILVDDSAAGLLDRFQAYKPHQLKKAEWAKGFADKMG